MRVGIVIPAFDAAAWIAGCVWSVLAQSHPNLAVVVVDDGSTDGTAALVPVDERVTLIRQPNAGVSAARNAGLAALPAVDVVLFLDADDRLAPDALSRLADTLARAPDSIVAAVGPYAIERGADSVGRARPVGIGPGEALLAILRRNPFLNGGHVLIRASAVAANGPFRQDLHFGEDWEYWVRLALLGTFATVPGDSPVLIARAREAGAYQRLVRDPESVARCIDALFAHPRVRARLGDGLARTRERTVNEMDWTVGRELFRVGRVAEARHALRRSVLAAPSLKRIAIAVLSHAPALWPMRLRGRFAPVAITSSMRAAR